MSIWVSKLAGHRLVCQTPLGQYRNSWVEFLIAARRSRRSRSSSVRTLALGLAMALGFGFGAWAFGFGAMHRGERDEGGWRREVCGGAGRGVGWRLERMRGWLGPSVSYP